MSESKTTSAASFHAKLPSVDAESINIVPIQGDFSELGGDTVGTSKKLDRDHINFQSTPTPQKDPESKNNVVIFETETRGATRKENSGQDATIEIERYKKEAVQLKKKLKYTGIILTSLILVFAVVSALLWIGMFGPPA